MSKKRSKLRNLYSDSKGNNLFDKEEEWAVKIPRVFGIPIARFLAWLPIRITPNMVTIFSLILAIFSGYFFYKGNLLYGALFFLLSYIFDTADGALARITDSYTKFGEKLDFYVDTLGNIFMYFGLWYSQYYIFGKWLIGGLIIAIHYAVIFFGYVCIKNKSYKTIIPYVNTYYGAADEGILTFFFVPIIGYFTIIFPFLVLIQLISYIILFFKQKEKPNIRKNFRSMLKI